MTHVDDQKTKISNMNVMRTAMKARLLDRDEETQLARAWLHDHDEKALHVLITTHERLAVSIASKFRAYGLPLGDLIQEGMIGLLEAANRYDPEREIRFSTYAIWWIRATIQDYILRNVSIVRTGTTSAQKSLFFNLRRLRAQIESVSGPTIDNDDKRREIAKKLNVPLKDVEEMEQRLGGGDSSLNTTLRHDTEEEWMALLPDQRPNPEEIIVGIKDAKTRSKWLSEALDTLSDRERTIIKRRHLSPISVTLEEMGLSLGVSKERVRQLETRAMEKIKGHLTTHVAERADLFA